MATIRKIGLTAGAIILVLIVYIYSLHLDKRNLELKLESTVGHNLFLLLTSYEEIEDMLNSESVNSETLKKIEEKLVNINGYSMSIDSIVGNDSLHSVSDRFSQIFSLLSEVQHAQQGNDQSKELTKAKEMLREWKVIINETYYEKDNIEGGKAELDINDFSKVETFEKKVEEYYKGISTTS